MDLRKTWTMPACNYNYHAIPYVTTQLVVQVKNKLLKTKKQVTTILFIQMY